MKLRFTKMHGQGNDFVVINAVQQPFSLTPSQIRHIADRHFGVGCDQLLVVEPARSADSDFGYRIFNADGGEVEQCGNGSRCFARFVREEGLSSKTEIRVETVSGIIVPKIEDNGDVTVNMGAPRFAPEEIPFDAPMQQRDQTESGGLWRDAEGGPEGIDTQPQAGCRQYSLHVGGESRTIAALSMGNPHAVQVVPDVDKAPVTSEGPLIENHPRFPRRVNAGFMQIVDRANIRLRVWERGAGETLACGTGACAAVVTGILWGKLDGEVRVMTRGGELTVRWAGNGAPVYMTGAATTVYRGEIELD